MSNRADELKGFIEAADDIFQKIKSNLEEKLNSIRKDLKEVSSPK